MSEDDPEQLTPWTRDQLWAEDDARHQRVQGRSLTFLVVATWLTAMMATYPFAASTRLERGAPVRLVPAPGMQCHTNEHCALTERMQLWRAVSPVVLCVTRFAP